MFPSTTRPSAYDDSTPANAIATAGAVNEADYELYGYDLASNRTSLRTRADETIGFSYDALNRMTLKDVPGTAGDVAYAYDLRGLQTSALFTASGQGLTTQYDALGRIASNSLAMGGATRTLSYLYDLAGGRTRITHPDGTFFAYDRDTLGRVTAIRENGTVAIATFAYDAQGRLTGIGRAGGAATGFGYDGIGRLASLGHDLAGN